MQRLVYTPKVEVLIMLENEKRLIDVTDDIVSGAVNRRLNAMSDMQLTLQNKHGRYTKDNRITPMDRIICRMSRVGKPFLTFSGFVDDSPYYQIFPDKVTLAASCTLKLLQNTHFDPGLPFVQNWFLSHGWQYNPDTGALFVGPAGVGNDDLYGTMRDIIIAMLTDIASWPEQAISVYSLPPSFLKNIAKVMQDAADEAKEIYADNLKLLAKLYGTADINVTGDNSITGGTTGLPTSGNIGIVDVARLALKAGFTGDNAVIAVAIAQAESGFVTNAMGYNPDSGLGLSGDGTYDVGLWQMNSQHAASGGNHLPAPPHGGGTLKMPQDWNAVKGSIPSVPRAYIESMWNPVTNSNAAYGLFSGAGFQFTPWSTYQNQAYKQYLQRAKDAIDKAKASPDVTFTDTTTNSGTSSSAASAKATSIADNIVAIAKQELAHNVIETATNDAPRIRVYDTYVGIAPPQPWCAAFASWVYGQAGMKKIKSANVAGLESLGNRTTNPKPGDMIHAGDAHVGIVTSVSGKTVSYIAGNEGNGVNAGQATAGQIWTDGFPPTFLHFDGVGSASTSVIAGTVGNQTGLTKTQIIQLGGAGAFLTQAFTASDTTLALALTGERAVANDISLMEWIDNIVPASGRVYCSTPSGSFLSFFPDRWGFFERTPYFFINDIEIVDLNININDTNLTTHVFTSGPIIPDAGIQVFDRMYSMVASIEDEAFKYFVRVSDQFDALDYLARYGARPYPNDIVNVNNPLLLWMNGWMKFMELWSKRFTSNASFTFMPELLPGGIVSFGNRVQMFVEGVTHTFDMAGGFSTNAELSSLAAVDDNNKFSDLPLGGNLGQKALTSAPPQKSTKGSGNIPQ